MLSQYKYVCISTSGSAASLPGTTCYSTLRAQHQAVVQAGAEEPQEEEDHEFWPVRVYLLVDGSIEVVIYIQVHELSAVLLGNHDVFAIVLEGHRQGLANAGYTCREVLAEDVLHTVCPCAMPTSGSGIHANNLVAMSHIYIVPCSCHTCCCAHAVPVAHTDSTCHRCNAVW